MTIKRGRVYHKPAIVLFEKGGKKKKFLNLQNQNFNSQRQVMMMGRGRGSCPGRGAGRTS